MSKMDYAVACKELRKHITLLLIHFDNEDEEGWTGRRLVGYVDQILLAEAEYS